MNAVPPSQPGPEIDPSPAPDEAPMSPSPEVPWPPQPAEEPALPPSDVPMPSPVEMPSPTSLPTPMPSPQPPITARTGREPSRRTPRWAVGIVSAGAVLAGLVTSAAAAAPVGAADRRFMDEATSSGMVEIVLGRLAVEKGVGEPVRRFGQQMVDDHVKANESLKAMAAAKGVPLPTGLSTDEKAFAGRMKKMKGTAFDRAYLAKMVADHQRAVALFAQASGGAADSDVKAFAQSQLPALRSHLDMARQASAEKVAAPKRGTAARE